VFGIISQRFSNPFAGMMFMLVGSTLFAFLIRLVDLKNIIQIMTNRE
jgi:hypothetical protein